MRRISAARSVKYSPLTTPPMRKGACTEVAFFRNEVFLPVLVDIYLPQSRRKVKVCAGRKTVRTLPRAGAVFALWVGALTHGGNRMADQKKSQQGNPNRQSEQNEQDRGSQTTDRKSVV